MDVPAPSTRFLDVVLRAVAEGTTTTLVGLPGSGRSTLLARVADVVADGGRGVVRVPGAAGTGAPLESLVLAGVVTAPPGRAGALASAVEEVGRALSGSRALLVVDDADDLDATSAAVLAAAARRHRVVVLATSRPPARRVLRLLPPPPGADATVLRVPELPFDDVHTLVADVLGGDVDTDVAARVYALSGGLPGLARTLVVEARRAGALVRRGGRWTAPVDLRTPALAVVVEPLLAPLDDAQRDALQVLAAAGPPDVATAARLVPWERLVALEDLGLLRVLPLGDETAAALFPPLLAEHVRHTGGGVRDLHAGETIARTLGPDGTGDVAVGVAGAADGRSTAGAAAVLGRVLRRHAATRAAVARVAWERERTPVRTLAYLDALVAAGAPRDAVEAVLTASHDAPPGAGRAGTVLVRAWEYAYRALVVREPTAALAVVTSDDVPDEDQRLTLAAALTRHVELVLGPAGGEPDDATGATRAPTTERDDALGRAVEGTGPLHAQLGAMQGLVRAEGLLAQGRAQDALDELASTDTDRLRPRTDHVALTSMALLCRGDVQGAVDRSSGLLDEARGTYAETDAEIEPHGEVVAAGLYLQGRLRTLRRVLTDVFAVGVPSPHRPSSRAGLLGTGALLSALEGAVPTARSMVGQLAASPLRAAFSPLARPGPPAAALAAVTGTGPREATTDAWAGLDDALARGDVLAAVVDGAELAGVWCDAARARAVAERAAAAQGTLLPALGEYLRACADGSPAALLTVADGLRERDLALHATRAHVAAVRALRAAGDTAAATREAAHLRALVDAADEDLGLVTGALSPAAHLTPRELEIARLVARGATNRQIADRLLVSERTVDNHVYRIFRKLGVDARDRVAALL
ncbi:helix-turn-helix transcriptional regulator [Cellulomonas sp. HD19AZ1]|uniref:helix-turn-helix domain-containing protein n=1 Tax=Cellulomonas sp. HD19AZ1 TaxID=2559593 RepID=UPI001070AE3F|nr:helix-turn-helix transcriptional regulator [Cellulomonas sp. HD19AZ1]TFH68251.1 LuxR family transcriptional regulator [Cellulomonas sp. HD19AZ1]